MRISPLGTYMIWGQDPDTVTVTDLEGTEICIIPDDYISHFDTTVDDAGDEVIVGRNNGAGGGTSGQLVKIRLKDGKRTEINSGGWCSHTSTRSKLKYAVSAPTYERKRALLRRSDHERAGRLEDLQARSHPRACRATTTKARCSPRTRPTAAG